MNLLNKTNNESTTSAIIHYGGIAFGQFALHAHVLIGIQCLFIIFWFMVENHS